MSAEGLTPLSHLPPGSIFGNLSSTGDTYTTQLVQFHLFDALLYQNSEADLVLTTVSTAFQNSTLLSK